MDSMKSKLSWLWLFATVNYIYCDVLGLMDPALLKQYFAGNINGMDVSQGFLLGAGILVEIPMAMIVLTRFLGPRAGRWTNIVAGAVMTAVQGASLFVKVPAPYYVFFSAIEIAATAGIVWLAWRWVAGQATQRQATEVA
jgi:hypothetical protein